MRPWHFGHVSASVRNTRLRRMAQGSRLPLCILVISISRDSPVPALSAPAESAPATSGAGGAGGVGTTLARSLAAGPKMPWYRTRWQRGRGINGMSFSISSCGVRRTSLTTTDAYLLAPLAQRNPRLLTRFPGTKPKRSVVRTSAANSLIQAPPRITRGESSRRVGCGLVAGSEP